MVLPLLVRSRLSPPEVPSLIGKDCACWLPAPLGRAIVTSAVADFVASACDTAVTFTVGGVGSLMGAVYTPNTLMVPSLVLPPGVLLTCHVTETFEVLVTAALNVCDAPGDSVTVFGETLIATGADDPPPQPVSSNALASTGTHQPRLIGPPARHTAYLDAKFLDSVSENFNKRVVSPVISGNNFVR